MKKVLFGCIIVVGLMHIKAQTNIYKQMFDSLKAPTYNLYMTPDANDFNYYGDGISYAMEALLRMYEQTEEFAYLEDFIYLSHEVIKNRDDFRGIGRKLPVWSTKSRLNNCYGPITHQTALILIPLAHYCYLSDQTNKELFSSLLFEEEFITFNDKIIRSLSEYSNWLNSMLTTTVEYYDQYYWDVDSCMIQFADDSCETRYNIEGTDRQMNWAYLYLYLALKDPGTDNSIFYLQKYEQIVCMYRSVLKEKRVQGKNSCYLWPESGWSSLQNGKYEDISHAGATIDLVQFSNQNKDFIQQYSQNRCPIPTFFSDEDLRKFANTFSINVYESPLKYHNAIDGSCYFWKYPKNCEDYDFRLDYGVSRWLSLSGNHIHLQLTDAQSYYYMIADYYTSYLYRPSKTFEGSQGINLLGLANAHKHLKQFIPVGMIPLDSLNIKVPPITPVKGVLDQLTENQFSMLFNYDGIYFKEIKFELIPNTKKGILKNQTINFQNIGFELKEIPLTPDEQKYVELNKPTGKTKTPKNRFKTNIWGDSTIQYIETIGNEISIKNINNEIVFYKKLDGEDYLFCCADFNGDHFDEFITYNKTTGLFTLESWNMKQNSFMTISNCKLPQNQFIEFITPITVDNNTFLVVYRGSDKTISIYSIDF